MQIDRLPLWQLHDPRLPPSTGWKYPPMFKFDANKVQRIWYAGFNGHSTMSVHGQFRGKLQESEPYEIKTNTSGRSLVEQAVLDLRHDYEVKARKDGYRFAGEPPPGRDTAMKGHPWKRDKDKLYYPVGIQPKLNGVRCLIKRNSETGVLEFKSNGSKSWDFTDILGDDVEQLLEHIPMDVELDGELYIHGMSLQKIGSIVRTVKTKHPLRHLLKYYIFGMRTPVDMVFESRYNMLMDAFEDAGAEMLDHNENVEQDARSIAVAAELGNIKLVVTRVAENIDDIDYLTDEFVSYGYEGSVIYKMGSSLPEDKIKEAYYKPGKSKNIIKVKPFEDAEGTVIDVTEGEGKAKGKAMLLIQEADGTTTLMTPSFDEETRSEWWENPDLILGKLVTFKFYGRTDDGKPSHANVIAIRDYEHEEFDSEYGE